MRRPAAYLATLAAALSLAWPLQAAGEAQRVLAAPAGGQAASAFPAARGLAPVDFPRSIRLADGVYAYEDLRAPGFTTVSLIVIGADGVLIADGQESPEATRRLLAAVAELTSRPVRWYVVGSDHADHTGGSAVLPEAVTHIVHPTSLRSLRDEAGDQEGAGAIASAASRLLTENQRVVDVGGRAVEILHLGRAHTGGDLLINVPDSGVLFMSEVFFNRVFPAMRTARPSEWLATIDAALAREARLYVPGHGFVEAGPRSRQELVAFRRAIRHIIDEAGRLHAAGLSVEEAVAQADWGPYGDWMLADSQKTIAIRQVYSEIDGTLDRTP